MKVEYKKPIMDKIMDAITEAENNMKAIEKIILTESEWKELAEHAYLIGLPRQKFDEPVSGVYMCGVLIEKERTNEKES